MRIIAALLVFCQYLLKDLAYGKVPAPETETAENPIAENRDAQGPNVLIIQIVKPHDERKSLFGDAFGFAPDLFNDLRPGLRGFRFPTMEDDTSPEMYVVNKATKHELLDEVRGYVDAERGFVIAVKYRPDIVSDPTKLGLSLDAEKRQISMNWEYTHKTDNESFSRHARGLLTIPEDYVVKETALTDAKVDSRDPKVHYVYFMFDKEPKKDE